MPQKKAKSYSRNELSIKRWAEEDRPREKMLLKGRSSLSDAELIAILLRSGTPVQTAVDLAKLLLKEADNSLDKLASMSVANMNKIKGIGKTKAATVTAALELGRRRDVNKKDREIIIHTSRNAWQFIKPELLDLRHEEFWIIILNRRNQPVKKVRISIGGISGTVADTRIIFKHALEHSASSVILVHNHPSGNTAPSDSDRKITQKLRDAGEILDIPVTDHIIFTDTGYFSFADEGLL